MIFALIYVWKLQWEKFLLHSFFYKCEVKSKEKKNVKVAILFFPFLLCFLSYIHFFSCLGQTALLLSEIVIWRWKNTFSFVFNYALAMKYTKKNFFFEIFILLSCLFCNSWTCNITQNFFFRFLLAIIKHTRGDSTKQSKS